MDIALSKIVGRANPKNGKGVSIAKEFAEKVKMQVISESGSPTSPVPVGANQITSFDCVSMPSSVLAADKKYLLAYDDKKLPNMPVVPVVEKSLLGGCGYEGIPRAPTIPTPVAPDNKILSKDKDEVIPSIPDFEFTREMHDMELTEYSTWAAFYVKKLGDLDEVAGIDLKMNEYYDSGRGCTVPLEELKLGGFYAAYVYNKSKWCRIQVKRRIDTGSHKVRVILIDEGCSASISPREIRTLDEEFWKHSRRSTQCYLPLMENMKEAAGLKFNRTMKSLKGQKFSIVTDGGEGGILKVLFIQLEKLTSMLGIESVLQVLSLKEN